MATPKPLSKEAQQIVAFIRRLGVMTPDDFNLYEGKLIYLNCDLELMTRLADDIEAGFHKKPFEHVEE